MHIPDGYLSPATCLGFYGAMLPVWYVASRKVEKALKLKELPFLSLAASFSFVIMMFNIPVPGGSSGHMVGASIAAIMLGPWAGAVALSLAITLQAFIFGDGGITALGANCFNMAFIMSFSGYYVFRGFAYAGAGKKRILISAALAGYISVNLAALAAALELGVQPMIAADASMLPLYAPYSLAVTIPAMMTPHLLFFGPIEALGTATVISYLYGHEGLRVKRGARPLWTVLVILVILTPIGLLAAGVPWGEWAKEEFIRLIGYIPAGMEKIGPWRGFLPGYGVEASHGFVYPALIYISSAIFASSIMVFLIYIWGKFWRRD